MALSYRIYNNHHSDIPILSTKRIALLLLTGAFLTAGFYVHTTNFRVQSGADELDEIADLHMALAEMAEGDSHVFMFVDRLSDSCAGGARVRAAQRLVDTEDMQATVLTRVDYTEAEIAAFKDIIDVDVPIKPASALDISDVEAGRSILIEEQSVVYDSRIADGSEEAAL